jgi:holo-[acyl-carrier protein] synthase
MIQRDEPQRPASLLGIGIDIVECARIDKMIEKHGDHFLERVYTPREIAYCSHRKAAKSQHFAGRWAAKEAVLKALGTGWSQGIQWVDIEVVNQAGGKPDIELTGEAARIAQQQGIETMLISISHCKAYATAYATALGTARLE